MQDFRPSKTKGHENKRCNTVQNPFSRYVKNQRVSYDLKPQSFENDGNNLIVKENDNKFGETFDSDFFKKIDKKKWNQNFDNWKRELNDKLKSGRQRENQLLTVNNDEFITDAIKKSSENKGFFKAKNLYKRLEMRRKRRVEEYDNYKQSRQKSKLEKINLDQKDHLNTEHQDTIELKRKVNIYKQKQDHFHLQFLNSCVPQKDLLEKLKHLDTNDFLLIYKIISSAKNIVHKKKILADSTQVENPIPYEYFHNESDLRLLVCSTELLFCIKLKAKKVSNEFPKFKFSTCDIELLKNQTNTMLTNDHVLLFCVYSLEKDCSTLSKSYYKYLTEYNSEEQLPSRQIYEFVTNIVTEIKFITEKPFHPQVVSILKELRPLEPIENPEMMNFYKKICLKRFYVEFKDTVSDFYYQKLFKEFGTEGIAKLYKAEFLDILKQANQSPGPRQSFRKQVTLAKSSDIFTGDSQKTGRKRRITIHKNLTDSFAEQVDNE